MPIKRPEKRGGRKGPKGPSLAGEQGSKNLVNRLLNLNHLGETWKKEKFEALAGIVSISIKNKRAEGSTLAAEIAWQSSGKRLRWPG